MSATGSPTPLDRFDAAVDAALEPWRSRPALGRVFQTASHVGDFSMIWHACGVARAITRRGTWRQAVTLSTLLGAESLIVNQGVKRVFRRARPTESGDARLPVRRPSTSSFPSGHASAAAFAATLLGGWDRRARPLWWLLAAIVGTSRAFVRIHHASDVVGGAVIGRLLGVLARRAVRTIER